MIGEVRFGEAILSAPTSVRLVLYVRLGVSTLPSTIPEIEHEIAHEAYVTVLDIDGSAQSSNILGHVVAEDDGAHRRLARARLAHQQHLALLLSPC